MGSTYSENLFKWFQKEYFLTPTSSATAPVRATIVTFYLVLKLFVCVPFSAYQDSTLTVLDYI